MRRDPGGTGAPAFAGPLAAPREQPRWPGAVARSCCCSLDAAVGAGRLDLPSAGAVYPASLLPGCRGCPAAPSPLRAALGVPARAAAGAGTHSAAAGMLGCPAGEALGSSRLSQRGPPDLPEPVPRTLLVCPAMRCGCGCWPRSPIDGCSNYPGPAGIRRMRMERG